MHGPFPLFFICFILCQSLNTFAQNENCTLFPSNVSIPISEVTYNLTETYTVIELDASTGARCLDGSNYKFLFTPGSGSGSDKFMFFWEGGGYCGFDGLDFLASCDIRVKFVFGSSNYTGDNGTQVERSGAMGFFSSIQEYNPDFYNWNKVFLHSCDGSIHQGYMEDPVVYGTSTFWFRGFNITFSTFNYLRDHFGLFSASQVILAGGSTGSHAFYIWAAYLQDYFPSNVKLFGITDSGLFLDVYNFQSGCNLFLYLNQQIAEYTNTNHLELFKKCIYRENERWKCMIPEYILMNIIFPTFVVNSLFDGSALKAHVGLDCVEESPLNCTENEKNVMEAYRDKMLDIAAKIQTYNVLWGYWLRACFEHELYQTWAWYSQEKQVYNSKLDRSMGLRDAVSYWYNGGVVNSNGDCYFSDSLGWDINPTCQYPGKTQ